VAKDKSDKPPASTSVSDVPVLVEEQVRKRYTTHFKDLNEEALQRRLSATLMLFTLATVSRLADCFILC
jgi:hypothetical protein